MAISRGGRSTLIFDEGAIHAHRDVKQGGGKSRWGRARERERRGQEKELGEVVCRVEGGEGRNNENLSPEPYPLFLAGLLASCNSFKFPSYAILTCHNTRSPPPCRLTHNRFWSQNLPHQRQSGSCTTTCHHCGKILPGRECVIGQRFISLRQLPLS